jgi:nucleotide-binding universal stress UspA family protein
MESDFSKILVCCDGSKYSEAALLKACSIAKKYNSELTLIHVIEKTKKANILGGEEYVRILRKYAKASLDKAQKIARSQGLEPKVAVKEGDIASEIVKFSKKSKTDLIVVGSKGLGAVLQFLLGSVSSKLAHHSLCSVLIVK